MTALPAPELGRPTPTRPAIRWFGGSMPVARLGLIVNLLVPAALLTWDAHKRQLGADPVNFAIHTTGFIAVLCLLISLLVTPLRMVTGFSWLVQFRRSLGVYAFYYGCAHLAIYFWFEQGHSLSSTASEILHRRYLTIGFGSLALMAPLWATSFDAAIRTIGGKKWKLLHRLAYVAAGLACWHFYLQSKSYKRVPDLFIGALTLLMLWRVVASIVRQVRMPSKAAAAPAVGAKVRFWKGELKVVGMFRETGNVRTFRLALPDGGPIPFSHRAGQFLSLSLQIDGKRVTRSYTIASPPTRGHYIELSIKREENGQVSRYLHDMLMTGHTVAVSAPAGKFTFDPAEADGVLLIAGGVGITPVMSILRDLTDRGWMGKIDLVFSVRTPGDVIFADELKYLSDRHPNLHVHVTITRDGPADWTGPRGRITADLLRQLVPDFVSRPAFVCGPDAMATAARDELVAAGVPMDRITMESFTPAAASPTTPANNDGSTTATVTFERSNKSAPLPASRTILDAAESAGVRIEFECRSGICGTCKCRLLSGSVTMDTRDALSDADEADGYILACQAHATEDVTIDA